MGTTFNNSLLTYLTEEDKILSDLDAVDRQIVSCLYILDESRIDRDRQNATSELEALRAQKNELNDRLDAVRTVFKRKLLRLFEN